MGNKLDFKESTIKGIQPDAAKQLIFWDNSVTGLGLRVSPGGTKTFFYQGRIKRKLTKITIGKHGPIKAQEARKKAEHIAAQITLGNDPSPKKSAENAPSLGDLMTAYCEYLEKQGKQSANGVKTEITRNIENAQPRLWKTPACDITHDDCMTIVADIVDSGRLRQADKIRSYLKTAYSEAIHARSDASMPKAMRALRIQHNPARELRKVKGSSQAKDRALSLSELRAYWKHINALPEPSKSLAIIHLLTGGQRQQQLARVTLSDIDRDTESLLILDSKGRRSEARHHVVPLLPSVMAAIRRITGSGEYVFSCNGGKTPVSTRYMNELVSRVRKSMEDAGDLENGHFTPGTIRATVETRLIAKPYRVSSDVLGHLLSHGMGGVQQRHYQKHDFFEEKLEALQMLERMVKGEAEPVAQVIQLDERVMA